MDKMKSVCIGILFACLLMSLAFTKDEQFPKQVFVEHKVCSVVCVNEYVQEMHSQGWVIKSVSATKVGYLIHLEKY